MMGSNELSAQASYDGFWPKATEEIRTMDINGLKHQELPLARIKKVQKIRRHRLGYKKSSPLNWIDLYLAVSPVKESSHHNK